MNRRRFVSNMVGAGCVAFGGRGFAAAQTKAPKPDLSVKRVLVMFKRHLDVGFIDTQDALIRQYQRQHYTTPIQVAQPLRRSGEIRYVWTTVSWLLYEYLEQAGT